MGRWGSLTQNSKLFKTQNSLPNSKLKTQNSKLKTSQSLLSNSKLKTQNLKLSPNHAVD
jgi:hypothetical protein